MRKLRILILWFLMYGCEQNSVPTNPVNEDTSKTSIIEQKQVQKPVPKTKLYFRSIPTIVIADTINKNSSFVFKPISEKEFQHFKTNQNNKPQKDATIKQDSSNFYILQTKNSYYELDQSDNYSSSYHYLGYMPELSCHIVNHCGEGMCEQFFLDNEADVKMVIPSSFDAGVRDVLISPLENYLLFYSSYDGPDYSDYYSDRAEFTIYEIAEGKGIQSLKVFKQFQTKNWSIEEMVWADSTAFVLKVFEGRRQDAQYRYLKTTIQ